MKDFRLQQLLKTLSIIPSIETLWYPHCGWDVQFINSKLMQTHLPSPNFYILNDTMNISLDSYIKKDKDFNLLSSTNVQLTDISKKAIWYNVKSITNKSITILCIPEYKSQDFLNLLLTNKLQINHIFTSRMAGGCTITFKGQSVNLISDLSQKIIQYKYMISDFHCLTEIGNLNRDDVTYKEMTDYAEKHNFKIKDKDEYTSVGNSIPAKFLIFGK